MNTCIRMKNTGVTKALITVDDVSIAQLNDTSHLDKINGDWITYR